MSELNLDEGIKCCVRVLRRVTEGFEQDVDDALHFRVADDFSKTLQATVSRVSYLFVTVSQHGGQRRNDVGQAQCQLLWVEISHGT